MKKFSFKRQSSMLKLLKLEEFLSFCVKPRWGVPLVNPKPFYSALTFLRNCRQKELAHVWQKTDILKK